MPKHVPDAVLDGYLAIIATANLELHTFGQPVDRAAAIAAARVTISRTPGLGGADYTAANGDVSGRKVTMSAKPDQNVVGNGDVDHVVLCDDTDIIAITTQPQQTLTDGTQVDVASWDLEIEDPT